MTSDRFALARTAGGRGHYSLRRTRRRSTRSPSTSTICIARRSREGKSVAQADAVVDAELARMGPLAVAVAERAKRRVAAASADRGLAHRARRGFPSRAAGDAPRSRLLDGGGPDTGDRHRRVHGGVQHHQRAALGIVALPESRAARLVWESDKDNRARTFIVAHPNYEDWKREAKSFSSMGIWEYQTFNVASDAEPEQVQGIRASVEPVHGAGRAAGDGPHLQRGGRGAGPSARGDQRRRLANPSWRPAVGDRILAAAQRRSVRSDRHHAEGIPVPVAQQRRVGAVCA